MNWSSSSEDMAAIESWQHTKQPNYAERMRAEHAFTMIRKAATNQARPLQIIRLEAMYCTTCICMRDPDSAFKVQSQTAGKAPCMKCPEVRKIVLSWYADPGLHCGMCRSQRDIVDYCSYFVVCARFFFRYVTFVRLYC